ncbi:MAG TPA: aromatic ring-hydroxylating dioxygenase subunit alpha [Kofleriaceae bacterium]|nr:aromatic ring-hydroxylating dioxygenase subunit alpha [Kofleriaceae bacterium]
MEPTTTLRLADKLRAQARAGNCATAEDAAPFTVSALRYRDAARCEREQALFGGPRIVAVSASLVSGACLPVDLPGRAALVVRGTDGVVRAFANACRHRGTRLVDKPCAAKALTCPYHAWTYDLTGKLVHVPHADSFPGIDLDTRALAPLPVTERDGLVWLGASDTDDLDCYLGPLGADVAALGLNQHVLWERSTTTRRCNWKLVVEAFLDGYHIRVLHRDSVYRFFLDAASLAEPVGPHIRAVTGRRALLEAPSDLASAGDLRQLATPSLLLFPSTVFVEHPDFLSIMTVHPLAPDVTAWEHLMLVPAARAHETEHWNKSWQLIEEGVFQREDLWVCEQAQRSIDAGAVDELLFGSLESPARWFHAAIDAAMRA